MGAQPVSEIRKYSVQEYLDLERGAEIKSEFYDGYIVAMAGANPPHNLITFTLGSLIYMHLRTRKGCNGYTSDQRVWIDENHSYVYPDITVACEPPEYNNDNPKALLNPTLIVEVLSPSTRDWDQRNKLELYQEHASLQEVLFVDSMKPYIGGFYKNGDRWEKTQSIYHPASNYRLQSIGLDLNLAEVYGTVLDDFGPINPHTLRQG